MQRDQPGSVAGAAAPHVGRLPARAGRPPGDLGRRRPALPRRDAVDPRRVPRRRGVLRDQRLPDHDAARARARPHGDDLVPQLLAAPGPAAARRRLRAAGDGLARSCSCSTARTRRSSPGRSGPRSTYVTNWYLIVSDQSYFAAVERPLVFQHLWSLAIEEQFYLVWPVLLLGMLRLFRGRVLPMAGLITAGAIASLVWMAVLFEPAVDPSRAYYGTDTRASGLLLGAALALLWKPGHVVPPATPRSSRSSLDLAGLGAVGVIVVVLLRRSRRPRRSSTRAGSPCCRSPRASPSPPPCTRGTVLGRVLGHAGARVDRQALVLAVPVALADLRLHPAGDRPAARRTTRRSCCASCSPSPPPSSATASSRCRSATARSPAGAGACGGARAAAASPARSPSPGRARLLLVAVSTVGASGSSGLDQLVGQGTVPPATSPAPRHPPHGPAATARRRPGVPARRRSPSPSWRRRCRRPRRRRRRRSSAR